MLNISRYPFPRKSWATPVPSPSPLNLERWHQASHSLIDIRPGGPSSRIYCRGCVGSVWDVPLGGDGGGWGGMGGGGKRVSNTTRRVDQDDPESGKGLRNGSVRSSTVLCVRVFLRGLPFFGLRWNLDRSAVGEGGGTYGHTYLVPTSTTLNGLPPPPSTRRPIMAQGPASAASSEQPKGCAIGPQLSRHALRKRRGQLASVGQGGAAAGRQNSRRADAWLALRREYWVCYQREAVRVRPVPVPQQQQQQSLCLLLDSGRLGMAEEKVVVVVWSHSTSTSIHPLGGSPPPPLAAYLPLAPLPTAPVFTVPPNEKCRAAAAAAARPGSVIKRPGSGDERFGRGEWTIAPPHDGRGHTAHWSQKPGTDDRLWEGPGSTE